MKHPPIEREMVYFGWLKDFNVLQTASGQVEIEQWEYPVLKTELNSIGATLRVRRTVTAGKPVFTFTTKTKQETRADSNSPLVSIEHENEIAQSQFDQFKLFATVGFHKTRYTFPTSGGLTYEVDLFLTNTGKPSKFIKIDLEIPKNQNLSKLPPLPEWVVNPIMEQNGFRKPEDEVTIKTLWKTFSLRNEHL